MAPGAAAKKKKPKPSAAAAGQQAGDGGGPAGLPRPKPQKMASLNEPQQAKPPVRRTLGLAQQQQQRLAATYSDDDVDEGEDGQGSGGHDDDGDDDDDDGGAGSPSVGASLPVPVSRGGPMGARPFGAFYPGVNSGSGMQQQGSPSGSGATHSGGTHGTSGIAAADGGKRWPLAGAANGNGRTAQAGGVGSGLGRPSANGALSREHGEEEDVNGRSPLNQDTDSDGLDEVDGGAGGDPDHPLGPYIQAAPKGIEDDADVELYRKYIRFVPPARGPVRSEAQYRQYEQDYTAQYEVYDRLNQKYNEVLRQADEYIACAEAATKEDDKRRWHEELWRHGARYWRLVRVWREVRGALHQDLTAIRGAVAAYVDRCSTGGSVVS